MRLLRGNLHKESEGEVRTKEIRQEKHAHAKINGYSGKVRANVNADTDANTIAHEVANSNANSFFFVNLSYIMTDSSYNSRRLIFMNFWQRTHSKRAHRQGTTGKTGKKSTK